MANLTRPRGIVLLFVAGLTTACARGDDQDLPPAWDDGPGTEAWNNDNVKCKSDADCRSEEACVSNICQMRVCTEPSYSSTPPLGMFRYFSLDREVAVV